MYSPSFLTDARKKNPYVGYFCAPEVPRPSCYLPGQSMKSSPYIGIFRHAPPEWQQQWKFLDESTLKKVKQKCSEVVMDLPSSCGQLIHVDGKLSGGGNGNEYEDDKFNSSICISSWLEAQVSKRRPLLSAYHAYQTSSLAKMYRLFESLNNNGFFSSLYEFESMDSLQKAGSDFLALTGTAAVGGISILLPMILRRLALFVRESDNQGADCSHSCDDDSSIHVPLNETSDCVEASFDVTCAYEDQVSVLREARLDYVITQVDISRMARNASRHLDVKSILALPTLIYKSIEENEKDNDENYELDSLGVSVIKGDMTETKCAIPSSTIAGGWSWQMVVPDENDEEASVLEDLETAVVKKDQNKETPACVICLESFRDGDTLRSLPCGHLFHIGCIDHWLLGTFSEDECFTSGCPTCKKRPIVENEEEVNQDGSVPSWAFARIGDAMGKESFCEM